MSLASWGNAKVQKMDWLDLGLIKFSCVAFGILLAILIPGLAGADIWWTIAIILALAARPFYRVYLK